jgi:hypothetical protein
MELRARIHDLFESYLIVGNPLTGGGFFHTGVRRRKYKLGQTNFVLTEGILLRLTEFILPPPHPSVKETPPRGGVYLFRRDPNL